MKSLFAVLSLVLVLLACSQAPVTPPEKEEPEPPPVEETMPPSPAGTWTGTVTTQRMTSSYWPDYAVIPFRLLISAEWNESEKMYQLSGTAYCAPFGAVQWCGEVGGWYQEGKLSVAARADYPEGMAYLQFYGDYLGGDSFGGYGIRGNDAVRLSFGRFEFIRIN